jgi:hypothetical protein
MKPTVTHLVEEGQSTRPGAQVKTWCGRYIRDGSKEEIERGQRPTCTACRALQDRLDGMSVGANG